MSAAISAPAWSNVWLDDGLAIPKLFGGTAEEYEVHLAALEYSLASAIIIRNRDDIKSVRHWSGQLEPFEHQIRNLITFCRRAPVAMIADEVGLGKTISAGLIVSELMTRRRVARTLVVCPKILMEQWQEELYSKFGINAVYESGRALLQHLRSDYPVVITTYHTARDRMEEIIDAGFDMVVLDEAHKLKSLHGQPKPAKLATTMADALKNRAFQFVLMLTATPIQNSAWDLYSLIDLLTTAQLHENPLGDPARFQSEYLERIHGNRFRLKASRLSNFRHIISQYVMRAGRRTTNLPFPDRIVRKRTTTMKSDAGVAEQLLAEALMELNALQQVSLAEAMMSSNAAFAAQASNLQVRREPLRTYNPALFRQIQDLAASDPLGPKFLILKRLLKELQSGNPDFRVVVFTKRRATQEALVEAIEAMGIRSGTIAGGQFAQNMSTIREFWKDTPGINVVVSTDAGAEGVNLQVCNVLVNYDLPWNPMIIEQRIGRVQRLGSAFQNVTVFNLSVKDSVEDRIIARLLEKFMTISSALGDIEPILSAANLDSDGDSGMQEQLRQMVLAALAKKDVEASLALIEESINQGKTLYEEEEAFVEETLGDHLEELHGAGPSIPDLEPVEPRMSPKDFVRRALAVDGAVIEEQEDGALLIKRRGEAAFTATFDSTDPRLRIVGAYGRRAGSNIRLYEPGSPAFEQLVGEWSARTVHATKAFDGVLDDNAAVLVHDWFSRNCAGVEYAGQRVQERQTGFVGQAMVRATAGVAHDRLDRLIEVNLGDELPYSFLEQAEEHSREQTHAVLSADEIPDFQPEKIRRTVESDADLQKFIDFYDKRLAEETEKAVAPERVQMARNNFTPRLSARLEGVRGFLTDTLHLSARYRVGDDAEYFAPFTVAPGRIVSAPDLQTCVISQVTAPADAFAQCAVSGQSALQHLLTSSEKTGRRALPDHAQTCTLSGRTLLDDEIAPCAVTGQLADKELLQTCEGTQNLVLPEELDTCEFSGRKIRKDQLITSEISNKRFWQSEQAVCQISGQSGHNTELGKCAETKDYVLNELLERCSVSGQMVRPDLLLTSEHPSKRKALPQHTRRCEETDLLLLSDEGKPSAASGKWVFADLLVSSEGNPQLQALPAELVTCEVSSLKLLPKETAACDDSHKRVHLELLGMNDITGTKMLRSSLRQCPETATWARPADFATCAETGLLVNPKCLLTLKDGRQIVERLGIVCSECGKPALRSEAVTDASGTLAHLECTAVCAWSGERLLKRNTRSCGLTGVVLKSEFVTAVGSKPIEDALMKIRNRKPPSHDELLRRLVAENGLKPHSVWTVESSLTSITALAVLESSLLGLRRTFWVGYVNQVSGKMLTPFTKISRQ